MDIKRMDVGRTDLRGEFEVLWLDERGNDRKATIETNVFERDGKRVFEVRVDGIQVYEYHPSKYILLGETKKTFDAVWPFAREIGYGLNDVKYACLSLAQNGVKGTGAGFALALLLQRIEKDDPLLRTSRIVLRDDRGELFPLQEIVTHFTVPLSIVATTILNAWSNSFADTVETDDIELTEQDVRIKEKILREHGYNIAEDEDWRPKEYDPPLDEGIAQAVHLLHAAGIETFESCEGGPGHAYPEPTVRFSGGRAEGFRALAVVQEHALPIQALRRTWTVDDGEPTGPYWELVFWRKLNEPSIVSDARPGPEDFAWAKSVLEEVAAEGEAVLDVGQPIPTVAPIDNDHPIFINIPASGVFLRPFTLNQLMEFLGSPATG